MEASETLTWITASLMAMICLAFVFFWAVTKVFPS